MVIIKTNQLILDSRRDMRMIEKDILYDHSPEASTGKDTSNRPYRTKRKQPIG